MKPAGITLWIVGSLVGLLSILIAIFTFPLGLPVSVALWAFVVTPLHAKANELLGNKDPEQSVEEWMYDPFQDPKLYPPRR